MMGPKKFDVHSEDNACIMNVVGNKMCEKEMVCGDVVLDNET